MMKQLLMVMVVLSVVMTSTAKFSDMKAAFDAAFVRLVADGTYSTLSAGDNVSLTVSDCTATPSFYPYPAAPTGVLKSVLDRKSINIGTPFVGGSAFFLTSAGTAPRGWGVTLLNRMFALIGANYGVSLAVNWVYFDNSPATFTALANGQIDITGPFFSLGAFFNGSRRTEMFEPTCTLTASSSSIYVKNGMFQSLAAIKAAAMTRTLKIGSSGAGSVANGASLFPTATLIDVSLNTSVPSDQNVQYLFDGLRSGMFDFIFDVDPDTAAQAAGCTRIDSDYISTVGGFFRRREQELGAPCPSGQSSNTININFAGILSGR